MAENRTHSLSIESSMDILYGSVSQTECRGIFADVPRVFLNIFKIYTSFQNATL